MRATKQPDRQSPPGWMQQLLTLLHPKNTLEEVEGDLDELYDHWYQKSGKWPANLKYLFNVMSVLPPFVRRRKQANQFGKSSILNIAMIRDYIKIAFRNLAKYKANSAINIIGLTFGMTCFFLISLYLFDELTFDAFHENVDRIYRITQKRTSENGKQTHVSSVGYQIGKYATTELPEVENAVRVTALGRMNVSDSTGRNVFLREITIADEHFFTVFDYHLTAGNRATALQQPYTTVISRQMALNLFGTTDAIGKIVDTDGFDTPFRVTGVCEDVPANSSFQFDILFSETTIHSEKWFTEDSGSDWSSNNFVTYLLLKDHAQSQSVATKIKNAVAGHLPKDQKAGIFFLQPLRDIHFYSEDIDNSAERNNSVGRMGDITYVYVFAIIGIFVLLIACINYINLTTARASRRAKEIGVRKVAGANRGSLTFQFLMESLVITFIALVIALLAVQLALPGFNAFTEKALAMNFSSDYRIWLIVVLATLLTGLLSGSYPAFLLSKFQPLLLIKGVTSTPGTNKTQLRQGLVVFQFTLSVVMIVATLVVYLQLRFVRTKNLGFNKEQLVIVDINSGKVRDNFQTIKSEYSKLAGVNQVSVSSRVPGEWKNLAQVEVHVPAAPAGVNSNMTFIGADEDFLKTFDIKLLAGRNFGNNAPADSSSVLINESAAKELGIHSPGEQWINIPRRGGNGNMYPLDVPLKVQIVGIVKDFNFRSLRETISPLVIGYRVNPIQQIDYFTIRLSGKDSPETIGQMKYILQKIDPEDLFEYHFLDQQLALFYREDARRQTIFISMVLATVFIACLGLFGLSAFTAEQRAKEIGVRKVLGASVGSIVSLLSKDFLKPVLIGILLATPLAWYAMDRWLQDFAYKIDVEWWMFALAGFLAISVALLTVCFQSIKAALMNPVKTLRSE
ncbi:ABC transporter permease [Dyadobacter arcticus]|uniref:ABC transport system permease protein n=1 Tax=Dyadobacter arcticus TaxID=1078754 RepID=A0ABX0ULI9_9BACT|nr:ABC transporter permease [Dyadobacter arcticus]NIJ52500.1 putative ABC transport system permease protein [Dyadobacter arcticus]